MCFLGCIALLSYGQGTTIIKGKIVDSSGEAIVGASVYIKGTYNWH